MSKHICQHCGEEFDFPARAVMFCLKPECQIARKERHRKINRDRARQKAGRTKVACAHCGELFWKHGGGKGPDSVFFCKKPECRAAAKERARETSKEWNREHYRNRTTYRKSTTASTKNKSKFKGHYCQHCGKRLYGTNHFNCPACRRILTDGYSEEALYFTGAAKISELRYTPISVLPDLQKDLGKECI